jgi:O-antigen ligase
LDEQATQTDFFAEAAKATDPETPAPELSYAEAHKAALQEKAETRDKNILSGENWLIRNGHSLSYAGLYFFTILVLFRPYELVSGLSFLSATAFYFAIATLLVYLPSQLATEGNLTVFPTEVKMILLMAAISLGTIPIAKDPALAWETFNDTFSKAVIMFIVMVNVLRTRRRLMGMIWLSFGTAFVLSYQALTLFMKGDFKVEGYRVEVAIGGMFGNPNDLALHLVTMIPLAICLGIASRSTVWRLIYWSLAGLFVAANFVTYSRGGFLGLIAACAVMVWKLGRKARLKVSVLSLFVGIVVTLLAPGNYGVRILSIFGLAPDEVGSRDQRRELLERSILVSLRNPWGIGLGNFPIVGVRNLQTHNAFTQVSSELGLIGLLAYLIFMISPFRKLGAIERTLFAKNESDWFYCLAIGLQASIVAYLVSSFFVAVAYNWFIYYLIAYAVAFRRVYQIERGMKDEVQATPIADVLGWNKTATNA